jgi:phosphopentomutase
LLIISDHGNDPTWRGTDHTREYGLLLGWRLGITGAVDLGERATFADVGATAAEALGAGWEGPGESFWKALS